MSIKKWWKVYGQFIDLMLSTLIFWVALSVAFNHFLFHWEIHKHLSTISVGYWYGALLLFSFLVVFFTLTIVNAFKNYPSKIITDIDNKNPFKE